MILFNSFWKSYRATFFRTSVRPEHPIHLVAFETRSVVDEGRYASSHESRMQRQPQLCHSWATRRLVLQPFLVLAWGMEHYSLQCCAHYSSRKSPHNSWVCHYPPKPAFILRICSLIAKCHVKEYKISLETLAKEPLEVNGLEYVWGMLLRKQINCR